MLMSQWGLFIDSLELARRQETLSGRLRLDALPRLADSLFDASGSIDYEVSGETDEGKPFLRVKLTGVLPLTCQRCLGALAFDLCQCGRMILVEPGRPWPEDGETGSLQDEACDAIEASRGLDLVALLEDEILLALPIAPRHRHCEPPQAAASARKDSPFAQLAALRRK